MKKWLLAFVLSLCLCGCLSGIFTDPETGEQTTYHYLDPNTVDIVEGTAEGVLGGMAALSPLFPWLAPFIAAGGGILATFKKMKPKLTASEKQKDDFARGGDLLAMMIEEIKLNHPEAWKDIGPRLKAAIKASASLEDVIREFRRLAPRV